MPTIITQLEQAVASISAGVGGYLDFVLTHFGTYATPRSVTEFILLLIAGIILMQMLRITAGLTRVRAMPADVEAEIGRLKQQVDRLSRTLSVLQVDAEAQNSERRRPTAAVDRGV